MNEILPERVFEERYRIDPTALVDGVRTRKPGG